LVIVSVNAALLVIWAGGGVFFLTERLVIWGVAFIVIIVATLILILIREIIPKAPPIPARFMPRRPVAGNSFPQLNKRLIAGPYSLRDID
jgi:hypothetical protein